MAISMFEDGSSATIENNIKKHMCKPSWGGLASLAVSALKCSWNSVGDKVEQTRWVLVPTCS